MKLDLLNRLLHDYSIDFSFEVNGKDSGVSTWKVHDGIPLMTMWYGNFSKDYNDPETLLNDPIFDGKTLKELASNVDIEAY